MVWLEGVTGEGNPQPTCSDGAPQREEQYGGQSAELGVQWERQEEEKDQLSPGALSIHRPEL